MDTHNIAHYLVRILSHTIPVGRPNSSFAEAATALPIHLPTIIVQ